MSPPNVYNWLTIHPRPKREPFFLSTRIFPPPYRSPTMNEPSPETEARRLDLVNTIAGDLERLGLDAEDAKRAAEAVSTRLAEVVIDASAVGGKMPPGIADALDVGLAMALSSTFIALGRNPPAKVLIDRETPFGQDRRVLVKVERA